MATFEIRITLHDATWQDYDILHNAMEGTGFSRTILSDDGRRFHMPNAEYCIQGTNLTHDQIFSLAKGAASIAGRMFSIVVTEALLIRFEGLIPVQPPGLLGLTNTLRYG